MAKTNKKNTTLNFRIRFLANGIAAKRGKIRRRNCWANGFVEIEANGRHGISAMKSVPFNSPAEIPLALEKAAIRAGIKVHPCRRLEKFLA